jgi:hypothetical protein
MTYLMLLGEAWTISQQTEDKREKIQALSSAKECYSMKMDLLTNATVMMLSGLYLSNLRRSQTYLLIAMKIEMNPTSLIMKNIEK